MPTPPREFCISPPATSSHYWGLLGLHTSLIHNVTWILLRDLSVNLVWYMTHRYLRIRHQSVEWRQSAWNFSTGRIPTIVYLFLFYSLYNIACLLCDWLKATAKFQRLCKPPPCGVARLTRGHLPISKIKDGDCQSGSHHMSLDWYGRVPADVSEVDSQSIKTDDHENICIGIAVWISSLSFIVRTVISRLAPAILYFRCRSMSEHRPVTVVVDLSALPVIYS